MKLLFFKFSYTVLVFLLWSSPIFGQKRMVDQEIICISPEGEVVNGEGLPLRFEMRNLGPDPRYRNDTVLYWLHVEEENGDTWLMYQGALAGREEGVVELGERTAYIENSGIKFMYPERDRPYTINFCVSITTFNVDNGDTISYFSHYDPNLSNNTCCKKVTILPKTTSIASPTRDRIEEMQMYPNPVKDVLYIRAAGDFARRSCLVSIFDVSGRLMLREQYGDDLPGEFSLHVNTSDLPIGIYYMRLQTGETTFNRKLVVDR